ncbi:MAG TPA: hypothetical protein VIX19_12490 [Terriglobales bacterium]
MAQVSPIQVNPPRRQRPVRPQTPADFAPDPAPRTPVAQPVAQPVAPAAPAQTPAAVAAVPETEQPAENLPPPTTPQVTYRNNLLTVQAMNSTLAGLLTAIRNKTGIQVEGLEAGAPERVAISMGPAPEGEVLAAILGGSKFDYVVVERPDSPGTVQRVLLSPRTGASTPAAGATPAPPASANGEGDDEDPDEAEAPQDTPARPPLTQAQPQQPQQQPPQAKTPEQLLEELKRMQQQQPPASQPQPNAPVKTPPTPQ